MGDKRNPLIRAYLALGIGIVGIGFSAILVRLADAPGPVTSFYRMAVAAAVLVIPFYREVKTQGRLPALGVKMAVFAGLFFGLDLAAWATGVDLSGATIPTLLGNTAPVWVGLGAWLFFKEQKTFKFWGGLALAFIGVTLILGLDALQTAHLELGSIYGLLAGIFYGGYFLFAQRSREHLSALTFFWIACFSSGFVLLIFTFLLNQPLTGYPTDTYLIFLAIGLIVQVLGWHTISYAQGNLPASVVAPTLLGQPVMTALLAAIILNEEFTPLEMVGGATVLLGIYTIHRSRRIQPPTYNGEIHDH
jgi:drug/metabolite transporter (DMT)-like permease